MSKYFTDKRLLLPITLMWLSFAMFFVGGWINNMVVMISGGVSIIICIIVTIIFRSIIDEEQAKKYE